MYNEPIYGKPVILVKAVEDDLGTFPNAFRRTYKCLVCEIKVGGELDYDGSINDPNDSDNIHLSTTMTEGLGVSIQDGIEDRAIMCCNFRNNKIVKDAYYLAFLVGKYYVLDNQAAFLENT